jgi:hypothetical protein
VLLRGRATSLVAEKVGPRKSRITPAVPALLRIFSRPTFSPMGRGVRLRWNRQKGGAPDPAFFRAAPEVWPFWQGDFLPCAYARAKAE